MLRPLRLFHSSLLAANYIGPPDPVSNIYLVIYHDLDPTNVESPQHLTLSMSSGHARVPVEAAAAAAGCIAVQ